ncbi:MAG TPA: ABC transporter ATP-binding protein [Vicinamibacterales bacterium]|nr:ABC transporter ATP-binding protein [Vicinamibacterales bacterium]
MLIAEAISKHYDTPRGPLPILENVSLTIDRGESLAVMGPSGCGKSTLLYILGALEPPTSGALRVDNVDPYALDEPGQATFRNAHVGFIFQDHLLLPQLSALDNVLVPTMVAKNAPAPAELAARARALLTDVGLAQRIDHRPGELSGGERQRVAIARALILRPSLLLCDEPTGNLDRTSAEAVASLLVDLHRAQQTMLVVVTHNPVLAGHFGRRYELDARRLRIVT